MDQKYLNNWKKISLLRVSKNRHSWKISPSGNRNDQMYYAVEKSLICIVKSQIFIIRLYQNTIKWVEGKNEHQYQK